jgi:hypothetical protein
MSEQPSPAADLSPEERAVWAELRRHAGRPEAIGLDVLAGISGVAERTVQDVVAHLIERHGFPIGSAVTKPMGYFVIQTEAELSEAVGQLAARLSALARRIAALKKSTTPLVLNQLAIELGEAAVSAAAGQAGEIGDTPRLGAAGDGRVKTEREQAA